MAHLQHNNTALIQRVRRIRGQLEAVDRALVNGETCATTLHLVAATRGALNGLMDEIIEAHVRAHVAAPNLTASARAEGADSLIAAIRRYGK